MHTTSRWAGLTAGLSALLLLGCAQVDDRATAETTSDTSTSSGPGGQGGTGGGDGGVCNTLENSAPVSGFENVPGLPPSLSGGEIPPGIYELVNTELYESYSISSTKKFTMWITGGSGSYTAELVAAGTGEPDSHWNLSMAAEGSWLTLSPLCGHDNVPLPWYYEVDTSNEPVTLRALRDENMAISVFERRSGDGSGGIGGGGGSSSDGGSGGSGEGGAGGSGGAPACNNLVNSAPVVSMQTVSGSAPVLGGGVIPPGSYELVSVQLFEAHSNATIQRTMTIAGGSGSYTAELVESFSGSPDERLSLSLTTSGSAMTLGAICGASGQAATWPFEVDSNATPVELRMVTDDGLALAVMERRP